MPINITLPFLCYDVFSDFIFFQLNIKIALDFLKQFLYVKIYFIVSFKTSIYSKTQSSFSYAYIFLFLSWKSEIQSNFFV